MNARWFSMALALMAFASFASGQTPNAAPSAPGTSSSPAPGASNQNERFPAPPAVENEEIHSIQLNSRTINYTATAGTLLLKKADGKLARAYSSVAYTEDDADKATRPITFAFNGGHSSAHRSGCIWKRARAEESRAWTEQATTAAIPLVNCIIAFSDVVFIDFVTTGYSRNAPGEKKIRNNFTARAT